MSRHPQAIRHLPYGLRKLVYRLRNWWRPEQKKATTLTVISTGGIGLHEVPVEVFHRARTAAEIKRAVREQERAEQERAVNEARWTAEGWR